MKTQSRRSWVRRSQRRAANVRRSVLLPESLEHRLMLASDLGLDPGTSGSDEQIPALVSSPSSAAEGENVPAPDLVAFAKALDAAGVKFYGAAWCPACTAQKELFEDGGDFLPFIESSNPDRTLNQTGIDNNISAFPTWVFPDNSREEGVLSLQDLSQRSGVAIPTSANPSLAPIDDVTVFGGSPLHIGLDGYDPNGGPLTYTVTSSNPSLITPSLIGGRSARISVQGFGDMVFQLFEDEAPRPVGRFVQLAESGFYDAASNDPDVTFHRVIDNFVAQFGDPTGTGAGGSDLGDFDDQFDVDLQHNRSGVLSYAKAGDDTNDSQLFITDVATRFLDGNHSIVGQLVEGDKNRDALTKTATGTGDKPVIPVVIDSVSIFDDVENGLLRLSAAEGASGTADITVTVTDEDGNTSQQVFTVTVTSDAFNTGPFLNDIPTIRTEVNTPATFQLQAQDVEGNAVTFSGQKVGNINYTFTVSAQTGNVTVTPPTDFVGEMQLLVRVGPTTTSNTSDPFDSQVVTIVVGPESDAVLDLVDASDTGVSDTDNITNATGLVFDVVGVTSGAQVRLYRGETVIGQATASGSTVTITTTAFDSLADGTYEVFATQTVSGVESSPFGTLDVTLDRTDPTGFESTPPTAGEVGTEYLYDAAHADEGTTGFRYSLSNAPTGVTLNATTGVLTWTPTESQIGTQTFSIVAEDAAGNSSAQALTVEVSAGTSDDQVRVSLQVTDASGAPLTHVDVDDEFFLRGFVEDLNNLGVFSVYYDVQYDADLAEVTGAIQYSSDYPNVKSGSTTTPGLIDEVGATAGSITPLGSGEFLVFTIPMRAKASGQINFTTNAPDNLPFNEILVFGQSDAVDLDKVTFAGTSLAVDLAFTASNDLFNVDEDSQDVELDVLGNDEFVSGATGTLTITSVGTASQGGTVTIASDDGSLVYTPAADFFGEETFTYTVSDGTGEATATVTVQVQNENDPPTAVDDTLTVVEDTTNNLLDVLANDLIAPDAGETLRISSVGTSANGGTVQVGPNSTHVRYTPPANFSGQDTFTYTISDGHGGTDTATVTVNLIESNDPPVARDDTATVEEDSSGTEIDVLANDDTAGDTGETLTITQVVSANRGGTATIANGKLVYTPAANFFGDETIQYEISDGNGGTDRASLVVSVTAKNDPPTANNDSLTALKDSANQALNVLGNDTDDPDDGETLTIVEVGTSTAGGTVSIASDGKSLLYTPATGFTGSDTFTYKIGDGSGETDEATVTLSILDYVPGEIRGWVFLDVNNDGVLSESESRLAGISVVLEGTDLQNQSVNRTVQSAPDGSYKFENLAPGNYTVRQTQPRYLLDGQDMPGVSKATVAGNDAIQVDLASGDMLANFNFAERGRAAQFVGWFDFLASTSREFLLTDTEPTTGSVWYAGNGSWTQVQDANVTLDSANTRFNVVNDSAVEQSAQLNGFSYQLARHGSQGNSTLVQYYGGVDSLPLQPVNNNTGGSGGNNSGGNNSGEGESGPSAAMQATSRAATAALTSLPGTGSTAEGESVLLDVPAESVLALPAEGEVTESIATGSLTPTSADYTDHVDSWMTQIGQADESHPNQDSFWLDSAESSDYEASVDLLAGESAL